MHVGHIRGPLSWAGDHRLQVVGHLTGQPVIGAAPGIHPLVELIRVAPHRIAAPAQGAHRLQGPGRHVEVEQHALGPAFGEHPLRHIEGQLGGGAKLSPLEVGAAHRQGLEAFDGALHRRRHGAGIEHIGAEVGAVVDAGEHQIGPLLQ